MTGRRSTTTTQPTPIEEVPPTGAPQPAPEPEPEDRTREYGVEELDERAAVRAAAEANMAPRAPFTFGLRMAPEREDYPLTVGEAIAEVTRRISHIAKDRRTEGGERYTFRGIDDVLAALHPVLGDVGLVILPGRMVEHRRETRATAKGGTLNVSMVRVRYRLIGPDGSRSSGEAWGEAGDSGDKATQKALSQAYKSFALQTFSIPTEASAEDDPDRTNEPGRPFTAEERSRAQTALSAALDAQDLPALVGVRRRAAAGDLLDVPILSAGDGGMLAPLSWHLDRIRTELEGVQP